MVRVTVARDRVREVRVGGREEGGDSGRSIPLSTSEARLAKNLLRSIAKNLLRSNPIFFEGVAEHGNVGIGTFGACTCCTSQVWSKKCAAVHVEYRTLLGC